MNVRLPLILLGLVGLALVGLLVAVSSDSGPAAGQPLLVINNVTDPKAAADQVDAVEITRTEPTEGKLVFTKGEGGKWAITEPTAARADTFAVDNLVRELVRLKPTPFAELSGNPAAHGLDKPTVKVTLRAGSSGEATLNLGTTTIGKDRAVTFVTTGERPGVPVAVRRGDLDPLFKAGGGDGPAWGLVKWASDFRDRRLIGGDLRDPVSDLQKVSLKHAGKELALERTASGDWRFLSPPGYGLADVAGAPEPSNETVTGVRPLLNALTALQADPADVIENPEPLDKYGLKPDDPNVLRVEFVPKAGKPEVLYIGKRVDEKAVPVKHFARVEGDAAVVKLQTDRFAQLTKLVADPAELRDRTLVSDVKKDAIDAIDVAVGGQTVRLRRVSVGAARQWVLYGGPTDPQIAGPAAQTLVDALTRPRAAREVLPAPNDAAFAPPEVKAEVKLWFDGTEPPAAPAEAGKLPAEPKLKGDGKPAVTLLFGRREGDAAFVRRTAADGTKADLKVPDALAAQAARGRLDYLDLKLRSFATNAATKLAFSRGAEPFELAKDEKPDPLYPTGKWTFAKPDRLKAQAADAGRVNDDLLGLLATQTANRVVSEQPSPDDLKRYGLDPAGPRLRVTVTQTGEPKELVYEFGTETDDKGQVYAKEGGRPFVFTVPKFVADNFLSLDLRDRTLYRIDRAKVQRVRVKGWKAVLGSPTEYTFDRKGTGWEAVQPAGFQVDPAKLEQLLGAALSPRAAAFVPGPTPEQGLDINAAPNAFQITVEAEGGAKTVLTLGNETDGGANVFAQTESLKGEVATLPAGPFKPFREKPAALGK
jgi:hypothetical protein